MAWWTALIIKNRSKDVQSAGSQGEVKTFSIDFSRVIKGYLYENFIDVLYISLSVFTYLYVLLSIITFVLQDEAAKLLIYAMEALSEPYLGALAIYVLVKEVERRKLPNNAGKRRGELFVIIWLTFLLSASAITYFSDFYELNGIYQTILTNSLAAVIIRIGSLLK
ncbi:MAG: hypothetical protein HYT12_04725 [Candidatus Liptonbacteria bacterium]|nr:hypothetical protein [Candidatus Liptonbacteria bacterium]